MFFRTMQMVVHTHTHAKPRGSRLRSRVFSLAVAAVLSSGQLVYAAGAWNGQDSLHVPISWCAVQGSQAQADPNLAGDTDTDAILWRRHERPTDNIFANPTGITFRSAINNAWGTFNFPVIADPDTSLGAQGDMRGEDVNIFGNEFNQLINNCDAAYAAPAVGRAGIGVTVVNARLFHDGTGTQVNIIGWGGCAESPAGMCSAPFDGQVVVIDNRFMHPASPNRIFTADPLDQLVGHEVGHALSLDHRNNNAAMMNPGQRDNDGDGNVDNIAIDNNEINALRNNALNVPGVETDPLGKFSPGRFVTMRIPDKTGDVDKKLAPYQDLSAVGVYLDKEGKRFGIDARLMGLLPPEGAPVSLWFLLDTNGAHIGAKPEILNKLGVPKTNLTGTDLIAHVVVRGRQATGELYKVVRGDLMQITRDVRFELHTVRLHPHFPVGVEVKNDKPHPVHDKVRIEFAQDVADIYLGKHFTAQVLVTIGDTNQVVDRLDTANEFVLEDASFPHCSAAAEGTPGADLKIDLVGLLPNGSIHGLLGPQLVFKGSANSSGGGSIDFPIPHDTAPGYHLVTVGVDGTALTADCLIKVARKHPPTSGLVTPYIIGTWDLRDTQSLVHLINPTGKHLRALVAFFDADEKPLRCIQEKFSPNDLNEIDVQKLDLQARFGVVKIVTLNAREEIPEVGLVGNQRLVSKTGVAETGLHPVPEDILRGDWEYIKKACSKTQ